jgi:hypothetical protein
MKQIYKIKKGIELYIIIFNAKIKRLKRLKAALIIVFAIILADIIKALAFKVKT